MIQMTTYGFDQDRRRERLREVVEAFGANPDRWPADERGGLEDLVRRDEDAARLVAQEQCFDDVLSRSTEYPDGRLSGAADRIMAAIDMQRLPVREPVAASPSGQVIAWPTLKRQRTPYAADQDQISGRVVMQAGALLAACLVAGIYFGSTSVVAPVGFELAAAMGLESDVYSSSFEALGDVLVDTGEGLE